MILEVPEIFRLIKIGAKVDELVRQIAIDANDPEKVFLGLEELARRGNEGREALQVLSEQSSPIKRAAKELYSKPTLSRYPLEAALGIRRYKEPLDAHILSDKFSLKRVHRLALDRHYTSIDDETAFLRDYENQKKREHSMRGYAQLKGGIEHEVINVTSTFGVFEPIYLELISPIAILELRTSDKSTFLLLGSLRQYQALEFFDFMKKINPKGNAHVIDIRSESIDSIAKHKGNRNLMVVQDDVLDIPYKRDSVDIVLTNEFFRSLTMLPPSRNLKDPEINPYDPQYADLIKNRMYTIFRQIYDTLKPWGKFIVVEPGGNPGISYKYFQGFQGKSLVEQGLIDCAEHAGFKITIAKHPFEYLFRPEISSAVIDSNGFVHYQNSILVRSPSSCLAMSCEKSK